MPPPTFRQRLALARKAVVGLLSDRSAEAAYGLLSGLYPAGTGPLPERGTKEILEGYSKMPWLRAVQQKIGDAVASTQWQLLIPTSEPAEREMRVLKDLADHAQRRARLKDLTAAGEAEVLTDHPLLLALRDSNELLVGMALLHLTQIYLDAVGEAFWIKERIVAGTPVGYWPIPPHWVRMTPVPARRTFWVQWAAWQGQIPDTEIVWFKHPDPANPYGRGTGIARTLADELETDEYAARHSRMTFLNRARPDLVISPKEGKFDAGSISDENAKRLAERWRAEHQGFWRAALPFFATRALDVKEISQDSMADLQIVELRKHERDIIIQTYGMPPEELGITESSNRATASVSEFIFKKNLVVPRVEFIRANIQARLVPEYDERLVLSYVSPVEEDKQYQLEAAKAMPGTLRVDEWRKLQGQPPLEDGSGQVFLLPPTVVPVFDLSVPPPPLLALAAPPAVTPPTQRAKVALAAQKQQEWGRDISACRDAKDADTLALIQKEIADDPEDLPDLSRRVARREPALRRQIAEHLVALREATPLADLEAACRRAGADSVTSAVLAAIPVDTWAPELGATAEEAFREAFLIGAATGAQAAGVRLKQVTKDDDGAPTFEFNRANQLAIDWAKTQAATLIAGASDAVKEAVRAVVADALRLGWGAEKTARLIRSTVGLTARQSAAVVAFADRLASLDTPISDDRLWARVGRYAEAQVRARALLIARTELASASSAGQQQLWDNAAADGVLDTSGLQKIWLITSDESLCPICEDLAEEQVDVDEPFSIGQMGPPAHPACRCATGLVRVEATEGARLRAAIRKARGTATSDDHGILKARPAWQETIAGAIRDGMAGLSAAVTRLPTPQVHVAAPVVTVTVPPRGPVVRRIESDEHGIPTRIVEEGA